MFRIYNPGGTEDTLQLFIQDTLSSNILDTVFYIHRISNTLLENGTIGTILNFNESDELFKGADMSALNFIIKNPHNGKTDTLSNLHWNFRNIKNGCRRPDGSECKQIVDIRVTYKNKEYLITDGFKQNDKLFLN
ncbi:MAG TPA: hypothetical protein VD908_15745 [Cytophagales bacterium]|nr:hypothetical protein [Cytophagales bacterium]